MLPRRCVACSGRCPARACCRRSVSQPAGSALSRATGRRSATGCAPSAAASSYPPPIGPLQDLTATGASLFRVQARLLRTSPLRHAMTSPINLNRVSAELVIHVCDLGVFVYQPRRAGRDVGREVGRAPPVVVGTSVVCLVERAVRALVVEVRHVLGQHRHEMARLVISIRSSNSRRAVPIHRSAIAFARGQRGGILTPQMPTSARTASTDAVN